MGIVSFLLVASAEHGRSVRTSVLDRGYQGMGSLFSDPALFSRGE